MKILLVEPSEKIQTVFSQCLSLENGEVFMVDDGIKAFKMVKTLVPEIVMIDIRLKEMSGIDLLKLDRKSVV